MTVAYKDYYKILGVRPEATGEDIRKAFRALARKYHPDVAKDKRTAEDKFKEINEAHEVLTHTESRQKYDQMGAHWKRGAEQRPPAGRAGGGDPGQEERGDEREFQFEGTGFSDFFEQFFGARAGRSRGASSYGSPEPDDAGPEPKTAVRGQDIQGDILITLEEALKGALRSISVRRINGRTGRKETGTYAVRIPAGVQAGQSIRVPGKGGAGAGGGGAGDIYLRVRYAQHPDWCARGADLTGHLELAPWEAVLGVTVQMRTLGGAVSLKIPPGTQQGHQLRIRGQGLPAGTAKRGDLYVGVSIVVPPHVPKEEESLWKQLAAQSTFHPRNPGGASAGPQTTGDL